jgi:hypothetical protein
LIRLSPKANVDDYSKRGRSGPGQRATITDAPRRTDRVIATAGKNQATLGLLPHSAHGAYT